MSEVTVPATPSFSEAMRQAEEQAIAPEERLNTEPIPEDAPVEAAVEAVEAEPVGEQTAAERLLAGRFKNTDELERGYEALVEKLNEQGSELGELRGLRETFEQRFAQIEARDKHVTITPDLIAEDPGQAVQIAWEQQDEHTLRKAFEVWREDDPFSAASWATQKQAEQREAQLRADIESVKQQLAETRGPVQEAQDTRTWQEAWGLAEQSDPKIREVASSILQDVAPAYAHVFAPALAGDAKTRADALVALAQIARGRNADNLTEAVNTAATENAAEAQQAIRDAVVVSQETSGGPETLSAAEKETRRMAEQFGRNRGDWWSTH